MYKGEKAQRMRRHTYGRGARLRNRVRISGMQGVEPQGPEAIMNRQIALSLEIGPTALKASTGLRSIQKAKPAETEAVSTPPEGGQTSASAERLSD